MKPIILWIEDRPATVAKQIGEAKRSGYEVIVNVMPHDVQKTLAQNAVVAIIVDVMLYGVGDLESIGIKVRTSGGIDAGWALLEHLIRAEGSPYRDIPVLVLSAHVFGEEQDRYMQKLRAKGGRIQYLEKYQENWQAEFSNWLKSLPKGD